MRIIVDTVSGIRMAVFSSDLNVLPKIGESLLLPVLGRGQYSDKPSRRRIKDITWIVAPPRAGYDFEFNAVEIQVSDEEV